MLQNNTQEEPEIIIKLKESNDKPYNHNLPPQTQQQIQPLLKPSEIITSDGHLSSTASKTITMLQKQALTTQNTLSRLLKQNAILLCLLLKICETNNINISNLMQENEVKEAK